MIIPDLKRKYTTVMAKRSPEGEPLSGPTPMNPEISKEEDVEVDGRHEAAQDVMAAMHEQSPQKMMEALANFIDLHQLRSKTSQED